MFFLSVVDDEIISSLSERLMSWTAVDCQKMDKGSNPRFSAVIKDTIKP